MMGVLQALIDCPFPRPDWSGIGLGPADADDVVGGDIAFPVYPALMWYEINLKSLSHACLTSSSHCDQEDDINIHRLVSKKKGGLQGQKNLQLVCHVLTKDWAQNIHVVFSNSTFFMISTQEVEILFKLVRLVQILDDVGGRLITMQSGKVMD